MNIGKQVEYFRIQKGLSHEELAKKSNLSKSYIRNVEIGEFDPTIGSLEQISKGLEITIEDLLSIRIKNVEFDKFKNEADTLKIQKREKSKKKIVIQDIVEDIDKTPKTRDGKIIIQVEDIFKDMIKEKVNNSDLYELAQIIEAISRKNDIKNILSNLEEKLNIAYSVNSNEELNFQLIGLLEYTKNQLVKINSDDNIPEFLKSNK